MDYIIIAITVLFGAGLTFFSGFGLGTLMLPVFSLFFDLPIAIGATAIVHFANNIFKFFLVRKDIHIQTFIKFGIPAMIAAIGGSLLLQIVNNEGIITSYAISGRTFNITWLGISIGFLMLFFALFDLNPRLKQIKFGQSWMPIGGVLSGFFGGFSGHQGAFRATFLTKVGLSKESFVATSNAVSLIVDLTRMTFYFGLANVIGSKGHHMLDTVDDHKTLLIIAIVFAFIGTYFGKKLLGKTTIKSIQILVGCLLILMGFSIGVGIL